MIESHLFEVPAKFIAGYESNQLSRFGGILKDNATGRIVGHLQESGISNHVMNGFLGGPLAPLNLISSVAANAQLAQVKAMLGMMQVFQFATLGVSLAGLGVSAVGFTVLNKKINSISSAIKGLDEKVEDRFRSVFKARTRDALSGLKGTVAVAEHKFALGESDAEWDKLGKQFIEKTERFRGELEHILADSSFDSEAFDAMLGALCLSNTSACKAFLLTNNTQAARHHAEIAAKGYGCLFDELTPVSLSKKLKPRGTGGQVV